MSAAILNIRWSDDERTGQPSVAFGSDFLSSRIGVPLLELTAPKWTDVASPSWRNPSVRLQKDKRHARNIQIKFRFESCFHRLLSRLERRELPAIE